MVLVPVLLIVLWLGGVVLAAAIALVTIIAAREVFDPAHRLGHATFPWLGMALALTIILDAAFPEVLEAAACCWWPSASCSWRSAAFSKADPRDGLTSWIATVFGALYVSLLAFVLRLGHIAPAVPNDAPLDFVGAETGWILLLVLAVWSYDTGAYLVGKQFGTAKFLTHISPSKTYAGLIGGVVATTIVVALLLFGLGQSPIHALLLGPLIALTAQAGDPESMLKRARQKDFEQLIPGHGGMLDRVDSFLFAAPILTLYVVALLA